MVYVIFLVLKPHDATLLFAQPATDNVCPSPSRNELHLIGN